MPSTTPTAGLLDRLLHPVARCLTPESARHLANLRADAAAQDRIEELADKATEGKLSPDERDEYDAYRSVGQVISILQSKALASLAPHAGK